MDIIPSMYWVRGYKMISGQVLNTTIMWLYFYPWQLVSNQSQFVQLSLVLDFMYICFIAETPMQCPRKVIAFGIRYQNTWEYLSNEFFFEICTNQIKQNKSCNFYPVDKQLILPCSAAKLQKYHIDLYLKYVQKSVLFRLFRKLYFLLNDQEFNFTVDLLWFVRISKNKFKNSHYNKWYSSWYTRWYFW